MPRHPRGRSARATFHDARHSEGRTLPPDRWPAGWRRPSWPLWPGVERVEETARRGGEHLVAGLGDADRVLALRRKSAVASDRGPAVREDFYMRTAKIDHRLD